MWRILNLELRPVSYDFSDAGLGPYSTRALAADGHVVANQVGHLEVDEDGCIQTLICERCGIVHCESGGWVAPRRIGDSALWIPCFGRLADGDVSPHEYRPPPFLSTPGPPLFGPAVAARLCELVPLFGVNNLQDLTEREVCLLMQWQAPARVLGNPGEPVRLRRELVIAAETGALEERLDQLEVLLSSATASARSVDLQDAKTPALYLDLPGEPEWHPLAIGRGGRAVLALDRDLGIAPR